MRPAMAAHLEKRVGDELPGALLMVEEPFAAREERRFHAETAQRVDNFALVARDFVGIRAEVEGQRDKPLALRQTHAADRAALARGHFWKRHVRAARLDGGVVSASAGCLFSGPPRQRSSRPALPARRLRDACAWTCKDCATDNIEDRQLRLDAHALSSHLQLTNSIQNRVKFFIAQIRRCTQTLFASFRFGALT